MSKNVFRDLGFSEEESAGLKLKSYLFMALEEIIRNSTMNQKEIAEIMGADQPKVSKILNGKFSEFSIERIAEYLQKLGYDIHVSTVPCPLYPPSMDCSNDPWFGCRTNFDHDGIGMKLCSR